MAMAEPIESVPTGDWEVVCFMIPSAPLEKSMFVGSGGAPPGVASVALVDTTGEKLTRFGHSKDRQIDSSFLTGA